MFRMVREQFFGDEPFADTYDCIEQQTCELIFINPEWAIFFRSSGVALVMSPEGQLTEADIYPVRVAPFEEAATVAISGEGDTIAPNFSSARRETCDVSLDGEVSWSGFVDRCVGDGEGGDDLTAEHDRKTHDVRTACLAQMGTNPFAEGPFGEIHGAGDDFMMRSIEDHRTGLPFVTN